MWCVIRWKDYKLMTGSPGIFNGWYPVPNVQDPDAGYEEWSDAEDWKPRLYNIRGKSSRSQLKVLLL